MRTLTKNEATTITAGRVQVGQVIVAAHEKGDGTVQQTWAVDAVEQTASGPRFTVSSPRTGKDSHTVLFGADGSVKVTGAVSGSLVRAAKPSKPTADAKPRPTRAAKVSRLADAGASVADLKASLGKLPVVAPVAAASPIGAVPASPLREMVRVQLTAAIGAMVTEVIGEVLADLLK